MCHSCASVTQTLKFVTKKKLCSALLSGRKPIVQISVSSTAVCQAVACAPVTQWARIRSPVMTSFLGEVFSGFFRLAFRPPLCGRRQHARLSHSGLGFDPRSGQVSWVMFFLGFSDQRFVHHCVAGGSMRACQAAGSDSIPGRDKFPGCGFFRGFSDQRFFHRCVSGGSMRSCNAVGPDSIPGRDKFPGCGFFGVFQISVSSTTVWQAVACAPVTQRARILSPVVTCFLGEVFLRRINISGIWRP